MLKIDLFKNILSKKLKWIPIQKFINTLKTVFSDIHLDVSESKN